ncbi:MAG: hypothetical protein J5J06_06500 [Phycisphaerae bacterium]|nr:hypothetical protein [Phycisphaerae bacterium]
MSMLRKVSWLMGSLLTVTGVASAQLPTGRVVEFDIHEDPNDPESAVVLVFSLELKAADVVVDSVGWAVQSLTIRRLDRGEESAWTDLAPSIGSQDGLWWVDHVNPQQPEVSEFVLPPQVGGVAEAADPMDGDLGYELIGEVYLPPPGGQPYSTTASLTYRARLAEDEEPIKEGDEEPVEVPPMSTNPT